METLSHINYKCDMEIAYYEMCAAEICGDYYMEAAEGGLASKISGVIGNIFKSLNKAIQKITKKAKDEIGSDAAEEIAKIKKEFPEKSTEEAKLEVDIMDCVAMSKTNNKYRKQLDDLKKRVMADKRCSPNNKGNSSYDDAVHEYSQDVAKLKSDWKAEQAKNKKIKKRLKIGAAITLLSGAVAAILIANRKNTASEKNYESDIKALPNNSGALLCLPCFASAEAEINKDDANLQVTNAINIKKVKYKIANTAKVTDPKTGRRINLHQLSATGSDGETVYSNKVTGSPNDIRGVARSLEYHGKREGNKDALDKAREIRDGQLRRQSRTDRNDQEDI